MANANSDLESKRPSWREKMLEIMCEQNITPERERKFKEHYECGRDCRINGLYPNKHDSEAFRLGFEDEVYERPTPK